MKITFIFSILISSYSFAQVDKSPQPAKLTHTMIDSINMTTLNQMNCDLAVAMSLDRKEIRVIRLDSPKGKMNMTYLVSRPDLVSQYGVAYQISDLVETRGIKVETVQASFSIDKTNTDLILAIKLADGTIAEKRISMAADFFKDHARQCIK